MPGEVTASPKVLDHWWGVPPVGLHRGEAVPPIGSDLIAAGGRSPVPNRSLRPDPLLALVSYDGN